MKHCINRYTYLIISNTLEVLQRNIITDGREAKRSVPICFFPNHISTIWFGRLSQISVRFNLRCVWLAVDATGGIPGVLTLYVLDAVDEI